MPHLNSARGARGIVQRDNEPVASVVETLAAVTLDQIGMVVANDSARSSFGIVSGIAQWDVASVVAAGPDDVSISGGVWPFRPYPPGCLSPRQNRANPFRLGTRREHTGNHSASQILSRSDDYGRVRDSHLDLMELNSACSSGVSTLNRRDTYVRMLPMTEVRMTLAVARVLREFLADPSEPRYGYELMQLTGFPSGKLYPLLARLQRAGLLIREREDVDPAQVGRPARWMYRLSASGAESARHELTVLSQQLEPVPPPRLRLQTQGGAA